MTNNIKHQPQFLVVDSKTGQKYNNIKDLPPELLAKLEDRLGKLKDENGDGMPDALGEYFPDQNYLNVNQVTPLDSKEMLKKFFVHLNPFSDLGKLINFPKNRNHFSSSPSAAVKPTPFKEEGNEKIRVALTLLAVVGVAAYLGWDWIVEILNI